ncbi:hypothetical protein Pint_07671 [Pistacia integerrima]|uniref:Uncharacterized protein n=1 Tax=Pistacia integerrima TaxID=434235 RepID=A0ACC0XXD0_9ROSI|nr:hypothetical protein Pint_07671 [Pistacia integerrima]
MVRLISRLVLNKAIMGMGGLSMARVLVRRTFWLMRFPRWMGGFILMVINNIGLWVWLKIVFI